MQLLVIMLLALTLGKNNNFNQFKPILESFGGEEAADAIKQAEELSGIISAVQALSAQPDKSGGCARQTRADGAVEEADGEPCSGFGGYPLAPIAGIADDKITCCLSRYVALGE